MNEMRCVLVEESVRKVHVITEIRTNHSAGIGTDITINRLYRELQRHGRSVYNVLICRGIVGFVISITTGAAG